MGIRANLRGQHNAVISRSAFQINHINALPIVGFDVPQQVQRPRIHHLSMIGANLAALPSWRIILAKTEERSDVWRSIFICFKHTIPDIIADLFMRPRSSVCRRIQRRLRNCCIEHAAHRRHNLRHTRQNKPAQRVQMLLLIKCQLRP